MMLQIFNVEHGGCALLTCDNGARVMIDCGHNATTGWYPGDFLNSINVYHLELLVVTNYDQDHISGYPNLADKVTIGRMLRNTSISPEKIFSLKSEDGVVSDAMTRYVVDLIIGYQNDDNGANAPLGGISWRAAWNTYPSFDDENNLSVLFHVNLNRTGFLFTGDMEKAGWRSLLANNKMAREMVRDTTVFMASHHGRESGRCPEVFDTYGCNPQIVVISDTYMKHGSQETTNYYHSKARGIEWFRQQGRRHVLTTRNDGSLLFYWTETGAFVT